MSALVGIPQADDTKRQWLRTDADVLIPAVALVDPSGAAVGGSAGFTGSANFTPAAASYSAGDIQDVAKEISFYDRNGVLVPAGSLIRITTTITKIAVNAVPSGMTSNNLRTYYVTPPSALADNAAWVWSSADYAAFARTINLGSPALPAVGSDGIIVEQQYIDCDIKLAEGKSSIFAYFQTVGGHTAQAVARQVLLCGIVL